MKLSKPSSAGDGWAISRGRIGRRGKAMAGVLEQKAEHRFDKYRGALEGNIRGNNGVEAVVVPFWEAILDLADESGDGALDASEFVQIMAAFGVSEGDATYTFGNIDADGNGEITTDEWLEALRQFWTSTDPDAPGNTLFGRY